MYLNRELSKSIKTNKLAINITDEEYKKIIKIINSLKTKYNDEQKIINNLKDYTKYKRNNLLVKSIIEEVLKNYDILKKYNVCVFLTGSYARFTNKINSDLDLHFAYKNKYRDILFKYEEIIYYILMAIFDLDRNKVHNMILSRINKNNVKRINNKIDKNDLEILFVNDSKNISYKIKGNVKSRIYLQYGNKKDLKTIYKYLRKEVLKYNREWAHVFYIFTNEREFMKHYTKLLKIEKNRVNKKSISKRKQRITLQIENINKTIANAKKDSIIDFKKTFQMKEFQLIYEYISYKRDLNLLNNINWEFINLDENKVFFKNDNVFNSIKKYLYKLFEIVEPLKMNYSIHHDGYINPLHFEAIEKDLLTLNEIIRGNLWKD